MAHLVDLLLGEEGTKVCIPCIHLFIISACVQRKNHIAQCIHSYARICMIVCIRVLCVCNTYVTWKSQVCVCVMGLQRFKRVTHA
jgi:hypothetical protein